MEEIKSSAKTETIRLFAREKLEVVGVEEVVSSTEKEAIVKVENGLLVVQGSGITISKLVPEDRFLILSGKIKMISFEEKLTKKSLMSKVFK